MNAIARISELGDQQIKPLTEFRRWLIMDFFLVIAGSLVTWRSSRLSDPFAALPWIAIGVCTCFAFGEACVQFKSWWRRIVWLLSGAAIGASFLSASYSHGLFFLVYLFPGLLEFLSSIRVRRFPWVWMLVTPAVFGLSDFWVPVVDRGIFYFVNLMAAYTGLRGVLDSEIAIFAGFFAPPLLFRAVIGSFIVSRKAL